MTEKTILSNNNKNISVSPKSDKLDILDRQQFVDRLITVVNLISRNKKGCTFAINGGWGVGKSFILEMFENQISNTQSEETVDDNYLAFHYNCWKYDYYEEPSVAIVSAMLDICIEKNSIVSPAVDGVVNDVWKKAKDTLEKIAGEFIKNKIGVNFVEIIEEIHENGKLREKDLKSFDTQFAFKKTLEKTREQLQELAKYKTIIVVVDEIDRCLPEYAIKVLERLHHLFEGLENTIIILAVDKKQLKETIKKIYGENVDENAYLRKFINFELELEIGSINSKVKHKYLDYISFFDNQDLTPTIKVEEYFDAVFDNIDIRTRNEIIEKAKLLHTLSFEGKTGYFIIYVELLWLVLDYYGLNQDLDKTQITINIQEPFRFLPKTNGRGNAISDKMNDFFKNIFSRLIIRKDEFDDINHYVISGTIREEGLILWCWNNMYYNRNQIYSLQGFQNDEIRLKYEDNLKGIGTFVKLSYLIK